MSSPRIVAVSISNKKGEKKINVTKAHLIPDHGMDQDAHAGDWHRQISLLDMQSIARIREKGLEVDPGNFAENITTTGIRLWKLPIGTQLKLGPAALVEITQIGKECHNRCAIYYKAGDCIMPREGVFARVLQEGKIRCGDPISIEEHTDP